MAASSRNIEGERLVDGEERANPQSYTDRLKALAYPLYLIPEEYQSLLTDEPSSNPKIHDEFDLYVTAIGVHMKVMYFDINRLPESETDYMQLGSVAKSFIDVIARREANLHDVILLVNLLQDAGLLSQTNFLSAMRFCKSALVLYKILLKLKNAVPTILNAENVESLMQHYSGIGFINFLFHYFSKADVRLVNQNNFISLMRAIDSEHGVIDLMEVIIVLYGAGLLIQNNIDVVFNNFDKMKNFAGLLTNLNYRLPILINQDNFTKIATNLESLYHWSKVWDHLVLAELVSAENCQSCIDNIEQIDIFICMLSLLYEQEPNLLTQANFTQLISHSQNWKHIWGVMELLSAKDLLNQANFDLLITQSQYAQELYLGLECSFEPLNQANYTLLANNARHAESLAKGLRNLIALREFTPSSDCPSIEECRAFLLTNPEYAFQLSIYFIIVYQTPSLQNWQNIQAALMEANLPKLEQVCDILKCLKVIDRNLLTTPNVTNIFCNINSAESIANILNVVISCQPLLINQTSFDLIIVHAQDEYLREVAPSIMLLLLVNPGLINQDYFERLITNPKMAQFITLDIVYAQLPHPATVNPQSFFAPTPCYESSQTHLANNERLESVGFPAELIPDKFLCLISQFIMDYPVSIPGGEEPKICALVTILQTLEMMNNHNPFTRQPLTFAELNKEVALKNKINQWVSNVVIAVENKRQAVNREELTEEEYKAIAEAAMTISAPNSPRLARPTNN